MAKMIFADGQSIDLTNDEFRRYTSAATRSDQIAFQKFRVLSNKAIINLDHVAAIMPDASDMGLDVPAPATIPQDATPEWVTGNEDQNKTPEPDPAPDHGITREDVINLMEVQKLKETDIAAATGFSRSTVHMAVKEGKISQEFGSALKAAYFQGDEPKG